MDQLAHFLVPKEPDHGCYRPQKYMYVTTTDNHPQSYLLPTSKIKGFLAKYAALIGESQVTLHVNMLLSGCIQFMLCLDVDYPAQTDAHHHKSLYKDVVKELQAELSSIYTRSPEVYDAYYMTREGSPNYHLVFPHVYLNRLDYEFLLARLMRAYPQLDKSVQGWMMYRSCKRMGQHPYQVIGKLQYIREEDLMTREPDLSTVLKAKYKKPINVIYTNLFFPGDLKSFKICASFRYPVVLAPQIIEPNYLLSFVSETMTPVYAYRKLHSELSAGDVSIENVYYWCKTYQDRYQFRGIHPVLQSYMKKFYPPIQELEGEAPLAIEPELTLDDLNDGQKRLYRALESMYTIGQFMAVMRDYDQSYPVVLTELMTPPQTKPTYTVASLVYELTYRHGQSFLIPNMVLCKKHLVQLKRMVAYGEIESYYNYLGSEVLPTIPIRIAGKEAWLFIWEKREWKSTTLSIFTNLFLNSLMDYIIQLVTDNDALKEDIRSKKSKYTQDTRLECVISYLYHKQAHPFDKNPWLLGLTKPTILDLKTSQSRLAIPEDLISKHTQFPFTYTRPDLFHLFLHEDTYHQAFDELKQHIQSGQPVRTFHYTGVAEVDALFGLLSLMFCHKFKDLLFFLQYLAQSLQGKNEKRWFLLLLGATSNGKTTILRLLMHVLKSYCGILNQSNFYLSSKHMSGNESPSPQLTAVLHHRIVVIEELTSYLPLNPTSLNFLAGNNRIYSRALYQKGEEFDIYFNMIFTANNFPNLALTNAIRQRIKILRFESSFLTSCTEYDFDLRQFPQCTDLNVYQYGEAFLSLLIHTWADIQQKHGHIEIPPSVHQNLEDMSHM